MKLTLRYANTSDNEEYCLCAFTLGRAIEVIGDGIKS